MTMTWASFTFQPPPVAAPCAVKAAHDDHVEVLSGQTVRLDLDPRVPPRVRA